jgi:transcription-repair coupling factor (superfamily II helicase)
MGVKKIDVGPESGRLMFGPKPAIDRAKLIALIQREWKTYQVTGSERLNFRAALPEPEQRIAFVSKLLSLIAP